MRHRNTLVIGITAALALAATVGAKAAAAQSPAASATNGKTVFMSAGCTACHGAQAQGTAMAPAIAPPPFELPGLITYVRQPTGKMPPISESTASDKQLADVYAYLQSLAPKSSSRRRIERQRRQRQETLRRLRLLRMSRPPGRRRQHRPAHRPARHYARRGAALRPRPHGPNAALYVQSRLRSGSRGYLCFPEIIPRAASGKRHPAVEQLASRSASGKFFRQLQDPGGVFSVSCWLWSFTFRKTLTAYRPLFCTSVQ